MTLNENTVSELLDQATPGPWEWWGNDLDGPMGSVLDIEVECGAFCNGGMAKLDSTPNLEYDKKLIALAPELARDWLRMRSDLGHLARVLEDFAASPDSAPADRFAARQIHKLLNGVTND